MMNTTESVCSLNFFWHHPINKELSFEQTKLKPIAALRTQGGREEIHPRGQSGQQY